MKRLWIGLMLGVCLLTVTTDSAQAQVPVAQVIKEGIKKVIQAVDLEVQRLQTQTIVLQNAQKAIENTMSELHLNEIASWVQKQKDLYSEYYNELWEVKNIITDYDKIRDITEKQVMLVAEYKQAWNTIQQDKHFTADELSYMAQAYSGILDATVQNVDQLLDVVTAFTTQMSDAARLKIIDGVAKQVDENYDDLHRFNNQNALLSLSRAKDENDAMMVKWMYGLE